MDKAEPCFCEQINDDAAADLKKISKGSCKDNKLNIDLLRFAF